METIEILEIIKQGESQTVEFKVGFSTEVGNTLCSFANTSGGIILFGVSDDGKIEGVPEKVEGKVASLAHSCKPSIYPKVRKVIHNGKLIIIVEVPHSEGILHSFKNVVYKRVGTSDMPLSGEEVINFARKVRIIRFDNRFCSATLLDIDETAVRRFIKSAIRQGRLDIDPNLSIEEVFDKLELKQGDRLTYAAVLLFGKEPQRFALQSEVRCARFKGTESLTFVDMKVLRGSVIQQIDDAEKFVMNHIKLSAEIKGFKRVEKWEYPLSAIREAITNAICHRDYFSTANVHVSIYDDRVEVWNPGGLPPELTIEALKGPHKSIPRNPLIANVLYFIKYIERWGTGTQRIINDTLSHGLPEPEFSEASGGFEVVFRKAEAIVEGLNERQKKAWAYLREKDIITQGIYVELCVCSISTAKRDLGEMVKKGLLKREGKARKTIYRRLK